MIILGKNACVLFGFMFSLLWPELYFLLVSTITTYFILFCHFLHFFVLFLMSLYVLVWFLPFHLPRPRLFLYLSLDLPQAPFIIISSSPSSTFCKHPPLSSCPHIHVPATSIFPYCLLFFIPSPYTIHHRLLFIVLIPINLPQASSTKPYPTINPRLFLIYPSPTPTLLTPYVSFLQVWVS